ncbi:hypothetical protein [Deinococcus roseus]|uniref:Uncharacterized protein n=1 Tax=Deinococcus roseus TaxID=392414 RepID=A0ABQ2CWM7_9DEIO|nr:hypothetical protein [Deinococcus roseus]GGJ28250.1 hypothetical protein GCM10008938_12890 [Deinococcus roseus]
MDALLPLLGKLLLAGFLIYLLFGVVGYGMLWWHTRKKAALTPDPEPYQGPFFDGEIQDLLKPERQAEKDPVR